MEKIFILSGARKLSAVIHKPSGSAEKLAVLLSGKLDSKDYAHLFALAEKLSELGFFALRFDPTGTWESEGEIKDFTVSQYLRDVKAAIDYAENEREKFGEIVLLGHSLGGMVAIIYGAQDRRISAVAAIMPPEATMRSEESEKRWRERGFSISKRDLPRDPGQKRIFSVPYSYYEDARKYSALASAPNFKNPLLLITGELDDIVLPERVQKIYEAANEPKKFVMLKDIEHNYRLHDGEINVVNNAVADFLKEYKL